MEATNNALNDLEVSIAQALDGSELKNLRTVARRFYVTEAEARQLEGLCGGVSLSAFVRANVFNSGIPRPRPIVPQINREAYVHLTSLRANCNQIARAVNTAAEQGRTLPLTQAYLNQLEKLDELLIEIGMQLNHGKDSMRQEDSHDWEGLTE